MTDVLRKDQLEKSLFDEKKLIKSGELKEDSPLDQSPAFVRLCEACRRGDLKVCQEAIQEGANINASDEYNYTPLILGSLCGHYEVVHLLLESGALCERDTFQGERCLYNALNDRIRNLLLAYDYSKSTDPLQPYAAHISSLFTRDLPETADYVITAGDYRYSVHKFILVSRSPYFRRKLQESPESKSWLLPDKVPPPSLEIVLKYIYLGELPRDISQASQYSDEEVLKGIDRLSRLFEVQNLMQRIIEGDDRRVQRQQRQAEVERGRTQIETWFKENVLGHKFQIEQSKVDDIKWSKENAIFADVLLFAQEEASEEVTPLQNGQKSPVPEDLTSNIPIGPMSVVEKGTSPAATNTQKVTVFPVHKAVLTRGEFFLNMFTSGFMEAQESEYLRTIQVSCSPLVLEHILWFFYGERTNFGLQLAVDVLFAADMLLVERLKAKAAVVISSLGNGVMTTEHPEASPQTDPFLPNGGDDIAKLEHGNSDEDPLDPYMTLRAAWDLRVPRLETFAARYFAYRLEKYIDDEDFIDIVQESANRITGRQETDSIEIIDDIRYYLSERFRLRFEGEGIEELLNDEAIRDERETHGEGVETCDEELSQDLVDENTKKVSELLLGGLSIEHDGTDTSLVDKQVIRTLDGEVAGDEFAADALNYQILMGKIDILLDNLKLDA